MARDIFQTTGAIKVAFYTSKARYKSVASDLGLASIKPNALADGVRPGKGGAGLLAIVNANLENGKSTQLYCAPDKLGTALKALKGKKVNGVKIRSTSVRGR